jgi:hypothetical protein
MTTSDWILLVTVLAILLAPMVALWIGGILQKRSDDYKTKLNLFGTLIGLRHDPTSSESVRALNLIDAAFVDVPTVREAWTRYYTALNDPALNGGPGYSIREERRRDLLLEMVKALGLTNKISSADLLRSYTPDFIYQSFKLDVLERMHKRAFLEEDLRRREIEIPLWLRSSEAAPAPTAQTPIAPVQPAVPPAGNGAQPGRTE